MSGFKTICALIVSACLFGCSPARPVVKNILLMDTFVRIEVRGDLSAREKASAAARAASRMKHLAAKFSYFHPTSELAAINRLERGVRLPVSDEMFRVLKFAKEMTRATGGAFDVAMGTGAWTLDKKEKSVSLEGEGVKLNLGGIAKGFIVDGGIKALKEEGARSALINAGGDMYCLGGVTDEKGWAVGIRDPEEGRGIIGSFKVRDKGVATSGAYERPGHLIDPRDGATVNSDIGGVTVVAPDSMSADALATAVYVMGRREGVLFIEGVGGAACVIVDREGGLHLSGDFPQISLTKTRR